MEKFGPLGGAYSGQVIGAVVKALGLDRGLLNDKTARRFFDGRPVSEYSRKKIIEELGKVLVDHGIVPVPHNFPQYGISMVDVIGEAVTRAALHWDSLLARIQSRSVNIDNSQLAIEQFLRLVVVDLSLRTFALLRMAGIKPPCPTTPEWAEENGGGRLLRRLTQKSGLTREELAFRLNVSDSTVDNWLDGKYRPAIENVAAIAQALAPQTDAAAADQLELAIHRQFTFAHLADLLVPWIGRESVVELSAALVRFVWLITEDVQDMDRKPIEEAAGAELTTLRFGTEYPLTHTLLRNLALTETDVNWRMSILAAEDWSMAFEMVAARSGGRRSAAGLAQDVLDVSPLAVSQADSDELPDSFDPAAEALRQAVEQEYQRLVKRDVRSPVLILEEGMALRRAIVRDFPLSPRAHLELGSFLGMAGKNLRRRDLIDEGIFECKMSAELLPGWDNPAVEPGIILANIGEFEEALCELERAKESLCEATPHLRFVMGYVLMSLSRYTKALEQLEEVIAASPDHALAFLYAARCAFRLRDMTKGIRYAKTARRLGEPSEYNSWKRGEYSTRRQ